LSGITTAVSLEQATILTLEDQARWASKSGYAGGDEMPDFFKLMYIDALDAVMRERVRVFR